MKFLPFIWRNLTRNKLVSAINIGGLALGFAAAILIGLYLRYQFAYESFLPGHERVYRLSLTIHRPGTAPEFNNGTDFFMADKLKLDYPSKEEELVRPVAGVLHGKPGPGSLPAGANDRTARRTRTRP